MPNRPDKAQTTTWSAAAEPGQSCRVCDATDARGLVDVRLDSGERVCLCGTHALMRERLGLHAVGPEGLRRALGDRRESDRRGTGEVDELAERLTAAFAGDRRGRDRRAS